MSNKSTENPGGSLTVRDREALGRHRYQGLLRFKDWEAGYCTACESVYNVTCPECGTASSDHLGVGNEDPVFNVQRPVEATVSEGFWWVPVQCRKCDFRFKVILHNGRV